MPNYAWRPKTDRLQLDIDKRREWAEKFKFPWEPEYPWETWMGLGRATAMWTHKPDILAKPQAEPIPYEDIPEAYVEFYPPFRLPWTPEETRKKPWRLGTKGAAEFLPDIVALAGAPSGLAMWRAMKPAGEPLIEQAILRTGQVAVAPLAGAEKVAGVVPKAIKKAIKPKPEPMPTALTTTPTAQIPEKTLTHDYQQLLYAHDLARQKGLIDAAGKPIKNYRLLAKNVTGKSSMKAMDRYEAQSFIEALESAVVRGGKVKIPKGQAIIPKVLMDKLPLLHEVGVKERFRQMPYVLKKIGLYEETWEPIFRAEVLSNEERALFRLELDSLKRTMGRDPTRKARVFDALENPTETHLLDPDEQVVYNWFKKFFDDWADRLKIPVDKRRKNYVTHTFEKAMEQDIKSKHPFDPELIRAMDFNYARQTFNPFLKQRLGRDVGLKRDPFAAAEAYEQYALRQDYYNPLVKKMTAYEKLVTQEAGPNAGREWRAMINRLAGRPDPMDAEVNYTLKEFGGKVRKLPVIGESLAELFERGNAASLWAHQYASVLYQAFLGLRPVSAIRNLSQQSLAVAEVGPSYFARGLKTRATKEGANALKESLVLRSRIISFLPGVEERMLSKSLQKGQQINLWMFKAADRQNVKNSFLAGYEEAKALIPGAGRDWWIKRGDEVAMKTQYLYNKMANSLFEQTALGRFLTPFTSWPRNFIELQTSWFKGEIGQVYKTYMRDTGIKIPQVLSKSQKRKQAQIYALLLGSAYVAQKTTDIAALQYVGWVSWSNMARFIGGELPSLEMIGGLADIVGGFMADDMTQVKQGIAQVRPDKFIGIIRQLEAIAEGKKDWIDLFIYRNRLEAEERERGGGKRKREFKRRERTFERR